MVKRVVTGARRRSARISALEERAPVCLAGTSSIPPVVSRKRGRKRKSFLSVEVINLNNGSSGSHLYEPEHLSSPQPMPAKQKLEFFLDMLQRRDRYEIFAQPVDGQEVVGYYDIIKDPMDFGTMRAKLQEGMYTSLEQFERDVFLISSNAIKFNASNTVYYTEARAINELAQRLFRALRREPENFEVEHTRTRRCPGRKAQGEASTSNARVPKSGSLDDLSLKRNTQMSNGPSHSKLHIGGHKNNNASTSADKRMGYMPWKNDKLVSPVLKASKLLQQVEGEGRPYWDSLMRFVQDLGPTAQMVARRKYKGKAVCSDEEGSNNFQASKLNNNRTDLLIATLSQTSKPQSHAQKINREAYFTRLLNHPNPSTKVAPHLNREGSGFCSPNAALNRHDYIANTVMPMGQEGLGPNRETYFTRLLNHPDPSTKVALHLNREGSGNCSPNAALNRRDYIANTVMPMGQEGLGPSWEGPGSGLMQLNGLGALSRRNYIANTAMPMGQEGQGPNWEGLGSGLMQPNGLGLGMEATPTYSMGSATYPSLASEQSLLMPTISTQTVERRRPQPTMWGPPPVESQALHAPADVEESDFCSLNALNRMPLRWNVPNREGPGSGSGQPSRLGLGICSPAASEQTQTAEWRPTLWGAPPVQSQVNTMNFLGQQTNAHHRHQSSWVPDLDLQL